MAQLVFDCLGARAERYAAAPSLTLELRITETEGADPDDESTWRAAVIKLDGTGAECRVGKVNQLHKVGDADLRTLVGPHGAVVLVEGARAVRLQAITTQGDPAHQEPLIE